MHFNDNIMSQEFMLFRLCGNPQSSGALEPSAAGGQTLFITHTNQNCVKYRRKV